MNILRRTKPCINVLTSSVRYSLLYRKQNFSNIWKQPKNVQTTIEFGDSDGKLVIASGKLARFADGCATAQYGNTCVMVTAVSSKRKPSGNMSFIPLTVDYRQKSAAAGRIPTNHLRREVGATVNEILTGRMIDRSIRPMFPKGYYNETQLTTNVLSVDSANDPAVFAINAASAALALSDIPWNGPVGAVRVGYVQDQVVINPSRKQLHKSLVNLIVSGVKGNKVAMLEASAENIPSELFKECLLRGVDETERIVEAILELQESHGMPKREIHRNDDGKNETLNAVETDEKPAPLSTDEIVTLVKNMAEGPIREVFTDASYDKIGRDNATNAVRRQIMADLKASHPDVEASIINEAFNNLSKTIFRDLVFERNLRCDGRKLTDLRDISCDVDLYKPLHGSALFQRGQTQVLCTLAFDSPDSAIKMDTMSALMSGTKEKNFFLHYEFPPYATNETGRMGFGRRELGHGALAEKGLRPIVPSDCPFTIRLSAEVLESNGSSSMASVCAGSLALMDAGVKVSEPAAGVAMGVITRVDDETNEITDYRILTDLLGIEDYMGDMDFKLAGTSTGVTALQADIKPAGMPLYIIIEALEKASEAKKEILGIMNKRISQPRTEHKDNVPVIEEITVPPEQVSLFVGTGGVNLRKLRADTGVNVTSLGEGKYSVFSPNPEAQAEGKEIIEQLLSQDPQKQLDFGAIYAAVITEIREYGVLVVLYPNMRPALVHNSQLDSRKIHHPSALGLEVGHKIKVKYLGRDPANGAMRLSRKILTQPVVPRAADMLKNLETK